MSRARIALLGLLLAGAAVAAGCGGGGGNAFTPHGSGASAGTSVQVRIVVPEKTNASGHRVPAYVSASTKSAVVLIFPAPSSSPSPSATLPPSLNVGNNYVNITPTSAGCTTTSGATTCMLSVPASISASGSYLVSVFTYDAAQSATCIPGATTNPCAGNLLSAGLVLASITPGTTNNVNVALGGIPKYIQPVELLSGLIGGSNNNSNNGNLTIFGAGQAQAQFQLKDAGGNVIIGAGAPNLGLMSTNPAVLTSSITSTPGSTGLYTITLQALTNVVGGQPIVTPTTVPLNLTVAVPGFTGTTNVGSLTVTVMHSVMYVARSLSAGVLTVDEFLDGNGTPAVSDYSSGSSQLGLAVDPQENLWIADGNNNAIVVFPLEQPGATPSEAWTFCGVGSVGCTGAGHSLSTTFSDPTFLSFDEYGNLYVSAWNGTSMYQVQEYFAAPGATPNPSGTIDHMWNGTATLYYCHSVLDNSGNLYVGSFDSSTSATVLYSFAPGSPTGFMMNGANVNGIGWAPDGSLWYLNEPLSGTDSAAKWNVMSNTSIMSISGIPNTANQGMAVDSLGNVYVASGSGTGVTEWTAASNWATMTTVGNSLAPTYVSVYPDGLYGSNAQIGVPKPTQSPIAIPTPSGIVP